jgi:hypothetical protein
MSKIIDFSLYNRLTNDINVKLNGDLFINHTHKKHKGLWGFSVLDENIIIDCDLYRLM